MVKQTCNRKVTSFLSPPSVVPSLLACLSCGVGEVRRAALAVLQTLAGVTSSPYSPLMERLLSAAEELIADPAYLSQVTHRRQLTVYLKLKIRYSRLMLQLW